ncbi:hypothetical protein OSB04_006346 [Centaurea solstitialis]|uniref:Uncharacterized protein n=1 Tax=Centaurea solstitialis TaxID=347529 RepID=A0AA38WSM0_9ASTR|nr:hypothetical protein OSB04_006346 [Centaurea solstitialis]
MKSPSILNQNSLVNGVTLIESFELSEKCKRLLIMAIRNDIFESLDSCETSKELWVELQKQLEGGAKTLKNNRRGYGVDSSDEEVSMKDMMTTLALMTREYRKGNKYYGDRSRKEKYDKLTTDDQMIEGLIERRLREKSLLAEKSILVTDESSEDETQKGLLALEDDPQKGLFCGMAKVDSDPFETQAFEVSTSN